MAQGVAGGLDPFADIAVPEHLVGMAVGAAHPGNAQGRGRVLQFEGFQNAALLELAILAGHGARQHGFQPLGPEGAGEADTGKIDGGIAAHGVSSGLAA